MRNASAVNFCLLAGALSCATLVSAGEITFVHSGANNLEIEIQNSENEIVGTANLPSFSITARQIRMRGIDESTWTRQEIASLTTVTTFVQDGGNCLAYKRPRNAPAPRIELVDSVEGRAMVMTPSSEGQCGGCVTVWSRVYNPEWDECDQAPPDSSCTICVEDDCPDPPDPGPSPDPPPPPEPWCWPFACPIDDGWFPTIELGPGENWIEFLGP